MQLRGSSVQADRTARPRPGGVAFGAGAYLIWGLFPAFFGLLAFANPVEILVQRILWTLVVVLVLLLVAGRLRELRSIDAATWRLAAVAAVAIAANWGVYVYGVTSGHVVECALGYFINPLVTVLFGVVIFRERLAWPQWLALGLGAVAVIVLTVDYGKPPLIALILACSFAIYGLVKKVIRLDALRGVAAEGLVSAPVALAVAIGLGVSGQASFGHGAGRTALLIATGPVTLVPLLLFALAAARVPLSTIGILQYLTPALQMAWGVLVGREPMPASRWAGFGLIWLALAVFTAHALRTARLRKADDAV
ncbi:EamA family transporter RarD [Nocardia sp. CDC159]|uniref:EamA family transporter RarD n=1 Tax=Nocardia pulmonis TaxID=2951408 RepID=A0A9X2E3M9_9NOCA|nr:MULTISPECIES: EamA family transporter RarD [Nocardia]MCM6773299.1 EamA family transporter RarD [Nocardia pulmonis]MCM6786186.1 EamA family transporter RarD [Nocardia sp. CDC159]